MPTHVAVALVFALSGVPAFLAARALARGRLPPGGRLASLGEAERRRLDQRLATLMRMAGSAILATAAAILWAGGDAARTTAVVVVMAVAVNALIVMMLVAVARAGRRDRPGP